ncbi:MAG: hypothetical protein KDB00_05075 [Planctomycetales bacterium]|nr:hypothetical protein [Planctomycetales bacterium]
MNEQNERMLCQCPQGHRLRASVDLIGKTVRCPKCCDTFVFGYAIRETVTDETVLKILGDAKFPRTAESRTRREPVFGRGNHLRAIRGWAG